MHYDNYVKINDCSVCADRMDCSRRYSISTTLQMAAQPGHAIVLCCRMPTIITAYKPTEWEEAEKRLWDLINHYNQYDPKGKTNLIYLCSLLTRCITHHERTQKLYNEIFSYQERECD